MTSDARKILADLLKRELATAKATGQAKSEREWASKHALRPDEVRRARGAKTGLSLDGLQRFADALSVEPWQLLFPGFQRGAPQFPTMSEEAIGAAQEIDKIADPGRRRAAYAGIVSLLNALPASSAPAVPVEPPQPLHESMRAPVPGR